MASPRLDQVVAGRRIAPGFELCAEFRGHSVIAQGPFQLAPSPVNPEKEPDAVNGMGHVYEPEFVTPRVLLQHPKPHVHAAVQPLPVIVAPSPNFVGSVWFITHAAVKPSPAPKAH